MLCKFLGIHLKSFWGFYLRNNGLEKNGWRSGKEPACQRRRCKTHGFSSWVGKIPWKRKWQPTPVFLPGKFNGQRSLVGHSPQGCKESDTTEHTLQTKTRSRTKTSEIGWWKAWNQPNRQQDQSKDTNKGRALRGKCAIMWTFFFLPVLHDLQDLSLPTGEQTHTPGSECVGS